MNSDSGLPGPRWLGDRGRVVAAAVLVGAGVAGAQLLTGLLVSPDGVRGFWDPLFGLTAALLIVGGAGNAGGAALGATIVLILSWQRPDLMAAGVAAQVGSLAAAATTAAAVRGLTPGGRAARASVATLTLAGLAGPALAAVLAGALGNSVTLGGWMAGAAAALTILPVVARRAGRPEDPSSRAEWLVEWAGIGLVAVALSIADVHPATDDIRTSFLLVVPLAWAGVRHGERGVVAAMVITNVGYVGAVTAFARIDTGAAYQLFLVGYNLSALLIAAVARAADQARRAARDHEKIYRLVAENATDVILVVADDGVCEYLSPAGEATLGHKASVVVGRRLLDFIHPDDRRQAAADFRRTLAGRQAPMATLRVARADGTYAWVERTARPFTDPARPGEWRVLAVARDVSERRRLEETLRQSQKLESVGRLAGGIAHDFNNLLTAILGHAGLLEEDERLPEDGRGQVREIRRAGERAAALTAQLLAFARRQATRQAVVEVNGVVAAMEQLLARVLGNRIRIRTHLDPAATRVRIDPVQLEQVLMNLAVNARDAMPNGGTVRLATRHHEAEGRFDPRTGAGPHLEISVQDTGYGMSAETAARIFEPFFTTKAVGKGTGLGLAVCHGIVQEAGGRIEVQSRIGRGTLVRVQFPVCADAATEDLPSVPGEPGVAAGETLLVVEPDLQVRNLVVRVLAGEGYDVLTAGSGEEVLDLLERSPRTIQAVISELALPGISGPVLVDMLHARDQSPGVLFISGRADDPSRLASPDWPADDLLRKPFDAETLRGRVHQLLGQAEPAEDPPRLPHPLRETAPR